MKNRPQSPGALTQDAIRRRAEEIYIRSGRLPGRDEQNWAQAEREILAESGDTGRKAVVITVKGELYVGEYRLASSDGYTPGEFCAGELVHLRFEGNKMILQRPNGRELETTLVKPR